MEQVREVIFYQNYFEEFYEKQTKKVRQKIDFVLFLLAHSERVPEKFLKHLRDIKGLYEVRVELGSNVYRIFCCFDSGKIVVLFNGFQKKTQKTPANELDKAIKLMNEYFDNK